MPSTSESILNTLVVSCTVDARISRAARTRTRSESRMASVRQGHTTDTSSRRWDMRTMSAMAGSTERFGWSRRTKVLVSASMSLMARVALHRTRDAIRVPSTSASVAAWMQRTSDVASESMCAGKRYASGTANRHSHRAVSSEARSRCSARASIRRWTVWRMRFAQRRTTVVGGASRSGAK